MECTATASYENQWTVDIQKKAYFGPKSFRTALTKTLVKDVLLLDNRVIV